MTALTAQNLVLGVLVVVAIAISCGIISIFVKDGKRRRTARYAAAGIFVALGLLFNWARYQMQSLPYVPSQQEIEYAEKWSKEYYRRAKEECKGISEIECHKKLIAPK